MADGKWRTESAIYKMLLASYVKEAQERAKAAVKEWLKGHLDDPQDRGLRMKEAGTKAFTNEGVERYTYWRIAPPEEWYVSRLDHLAGVTNEQAARMNLERAEKERAIQEAKEQERETHYHRSRRAG